MSAEQSLANGPAARPKLDYEDFRLVTLERLQPGHTLRFPLRDQEGLLLLAEGSVVSDRLIDVLRQREVKNILVHREEMSANVLLLGATGSRLKAEPFRPGAKVRVFTNSSRRLDSQLVDKISASLKQSEPPFLKEIPPPRAIPYAESLARELCQTHEQSVTKLRSIVTAVAGKQEEGEQQARSVVEDYLALAIKDLDLFACVATAPYRSHYPHRHSLHVAMLSLAMGVRAKLGSEQLHALGLGALLHDLGMIRVHRRVWSRRGRLPVSQMYDVMQHPIHTVDALERLKGLPDDVRYICYQVHERVGGQGYPRQVPGEFIHPLAKLVAVADTYVAMVSDRPHRPAILPYMALETILRKTHAGWYDVAAARLLLETLSLYPVGTHVLLNDDRRAKVVRSNGAHYNRPIVRVWPKGVNPTDESGELVNLLDRQDLSVIEALPVPTT